MKDFDSLLAFDFVPLSEAKSRLSEQIQRTKSKKIAITSHGKPVAVLLSYQDYLTLLRQHPSRAGSEASQTTLDFNDWKKSNSERQKVSQSILDLFDMEQLSRKGQKKYKENLVGEFTSKNS